MSRIHSKRHSLDDATERVLGINFHDTFNDGKRSVDYVLVYSKSSHRSNDYSRSQTHALLRKKFLTNLAKEGVEYEIDGESDDNFCFVKLHAGKLVLEKYCELLKWKVPIKTNVLHRRGTKEWKFGSSRRDYTFDGCQNSPVFSSLPASKYKVHYEYSRAKRYLFDDTDPNFFSPAIKISTIRYILQRTSFLDLESDEVTNLLLSKSSKGVQTLFHLGAFIDGYALHDGLPTDSHSKRGLLLKNWVAMKNWKTAQPLDEIKNYFGAQIAFYYAWLGLYTKMLILPTIVGILCMIYGWFQMDKNQVTVETCNATKTWLMCPICDKKCDYWMLSDTCQYSRLSNLFDNDVTVVFAVFISLWTTLFLEVWKRYSAHLIHNWGLKNYTRRIEPKRPEYQETESEESHEEAITFDLNTNPRWKKTAKPLRYCLSFSVSLLGVFLVLATTFAVIIYRMSLNAAYNIYGNRDSITYRITVLPMTGALINLVIIKILNYFYYHVAVYLTEKELPRTQSEYDESLSLKIYLFQFVNYYSSIFYIALIKGKFIGYPAKYNRIFRFRQEECPVTCMTELCIQLATIMVGKQILYTLTELIWDPIWLLLWKLVSKATEWRKQKKRKRTYSTAPNQWSQDFRLSNLDFFALFGEYLEVMIQFGFITIFAVAFPLAPLFALINNIFEIRLDARKFLLYYRRPNPRRAKGIGTWYNILQVICRLSILSNAFIIAFSSNFIPKLIYKLHQQYEFISSNTSYLEHHLSQFDTRDFEPLARPNSTDFVNVTTCYYAAYRAPPTDENSKYQLTITHWHILAARLTFIVLYQNIVGFVQIFTDWCIPDIPTLIKTRMRHEEQVISEVILEEEKRRAAILAENQFRAQRQGSQKEDE